MAAPARAEILTLACSNGLKIDIDVDGLRVRTHTSFKPTWVSARISDREVYWEVPRYEPSEGGIWVETLYLLDRYSGWLISTPICLSRDAGWCTGDTTGRTCEKAEDEKPLF